MSKRANNFAKEADSMADPEGALHQEVMSGLAVQILENKTHLDSVPKQLRRKVALVVATVQKTVSQTDPLISKAHIRKVKSVLASLASPTAPPVKAERKEYTVNELRLCILMAVTGRKTVAAAERMYGVPRRTYYTYKNKLLTDLPIEAGAGAEAVKLYLHNAENYNTIATAVYCMDFTGPGPQSIISPMDRDIMALKMDLRDAASAGASRNDIGTVSRLFVENKINLLRSELGDKEEVPESNAELERLVNAKFSRTFIRKNFLLSGSLTPGIANTAPKMTKTSPLSLPRVKGTSPVVLNKMFEKFIAHQEDLITKGIFPPGGPAACQVINVDEVGFDPEGRVLSTFSTSKGSGERRFHARTGEHAPFWKNNTILKKLKRVVVV